MVGTGEYLREDAFTQPNRHEIRNGPVEESRARTADGAAGTKDPPHVTDPTTRKINKRGDAIECLMVACVRSRNTASQKITERHLSFPAEIFTHPN